MNVEQPQFLKPPRIAKELGVARETVLAWIHAGSLKASNVASGSRPRYVVYRDDLFTFLKTRQRPSPVPRTPRKKQAGDVIEFF